MSPPSFVTQFSPELCHESVFKKETEEDAMSRHFVSPRCLLEKGNRCGYTSTVSVSLLCLQKTSEIIWPAQLRDTITTGIVSRGCLQKGSRRGYDVYTCRIPSLPNKKGEPLRIHFYSFCIPSRLTKNIRSSFPCPASRHNYRGICVTRLSSKNEKKRMRVLHMSYSCTVWWKRVEVADSLLHFYTLGMHSLSSKNHLK